MKFSYIIAKFLLIFRKAKDFVLIFRNLVAKTFLSRKTLFRQYFGKKNAGWDSRKILICISRKQRGIEFSDNFPIFCKIISNFCFFTIEIFWDTKMIMSKWDISHFCEKPYKKCNNNLWFLSCLLVSYFHINNSAPFFIYFL